MSTPLKLQIRTRMTGDTTLTPMLGSGANSIMPQPGKHPDKDSATPFIVLRVGAETPTSEITARLFFTLWVYDDPLQAYWDVDAVIARLRSRFEGYEGFTFDGRSWGRCTYDGTGDEETDDEWNKVMKWVRFSVPRV